MRSSGRITKLHAIYSVYNIFIDMETTKKKRTREEVRAAFRETMRRRKERIEENLKRIDELELQGFFA